MAHMPAAAESIAAPAESSSAARPARARWIFAAVFLALGLFVTWANREAFFSTALYEEGDNAANALQIHRAKQFRELHGNYSRFGFHHPGPAFFYVYAAGERLWHDWLHIAPTPNNAHIYTGTLLQLAFYAAAIAVAVRRCRQPWVAAALGVVAAGAHYGFVDRAIYSIWPPDVVVMPFLCFILAAAAVSRGERFVLPILVLAGGFLVHGHIAQPLFVGPTVVLALALAWRSRWRDELRGLGRDVAGRITLGLVALFLLPLVADLFALGASNAYNVWVHVRHQAAAGQTLVQSAVFYASYFVLLHDPSIFNDLSTASFAVFRERAWLLVLWLGLAIFACAVVRTRPRGRMPTDNVHFLRRLMLFWLTGGALTLVWGIRQDGGFTIYNSCFNHSLVHLVALAGILALDEILPPLSRRVGGLATAAAAFSFAATVPYQFAVGSRGDELTVRLPALRQADPNPAAPKLITFAAADWYEAVTLGRALQRAGVDFFVHPNFAILFGADKTIDDAGPFDRAAFSVWHVVPRHRAPPEAHVLNRECSVVFPTTATRLALPLTLDFGANRHLDLWSFGFSRAFEGWAWTEGRTSALSFETESIAAPLTLTLEASGLVGEKTPQTQRVEIFVNGDSIGSREFAARGTQTWRVPAEIWNRRSPRTLTFRLPDAISPAALGRSGDRRLLGLRIHRLDVTPAGP